MDVESANREACKRILDARPVWKDVKIAGEVIPGMAKNRIFHTGPPIEWDRMCLPQKASITAAMMFEGLCNGMQEAEQLVKRGEVELDINQNHQSIGPMSGPISYSMAVCEVENVAFGNKVYSAPFNTGRKSPLYFGVFTEEALNIQKWIAEVWAPATSQALKLLGGIDCRALVGQSVLMGDEQHNRNQAATALFMNEIVKGYIQLDLPKDVFIEILDYMSENSEMFWATPHLAVSKSMMDPAHGIENSTVVTKMSSNGTEFGIMVSGLKDQWFTAPSPNVEGLYFAGYSKKDGHPDLGGSRIKETAGFGGMCIASSPAMCLLIGGKAKDTIRHTLNMYEITVTENPAYQIPYLDFRGIPTGIDIVKVVETGITPIITTGINHKRENFGHIGVGVTISPLECFEKALQAL
ncbi:MAG: DUF1116 domain-containing protein [Deltaproteobacteria bacterium]|nr:DUF1116 domain-containing protein [Deltaproteobacteria bacterium]